MPMNSQNDDHKISYIFLEKKNREVYNILSRDEL